MLPQNTRHHLNWIEEKVTAIGGKEGSPVNQTHIKWRKWQDSILFVLIILNWWDILPGGLFSFMSHVRVRRGEILVFFHNALWKMVEFGTYKITCFMGLALKALKVKKTWQFTTIWSGFLWMLVGEIIYRGPFAVLRDWLYAWWNTPTIWGLLGQSTSSYNMNCTWGLLDNVI